MLLFLWNKKENRIEDFVWPGNELATVCNIQLVRLIYNEEKKRFLFFNLFFRRPSHRNPKLEGEICGKYTYFDLNNFQCIFIGFCSSTYLSLFACENKQLEETISPALEIKTLNQCENKLSYRKNLDSCYNDAINTYIAKVVLCLSFGHTAFKLIGYA